MRKGRDLIGREVLADDAAGRLRTIRDIVFDSTGDQVLGFVVDEGGWFSDAEVLPLENVKRFERYRVIVPTRNAIIKAREAPEIKAVLEQDSVLKDTRLITEDNREIGRLSDIYFDERTGRIEGYEVESGPFTARGFDRWFVPALGPLQVSDGRAVVPVETLARMEEEAPSRLELTRGRRIRNVVATEEGVIIAAPGQIVTDRVISRARTFGVEDPLIGAADVDVPQHAPLRMADLWPVQRQQTRREESTRLRRVQGKVEAEPPADDERPLDDERPVTEERPVKEERPVGTPRRT